MAAMLLTGGCGPCPPATCSSWLVLSIATNDWPAGQVLVQIDAPGFQHTCEGYVLQDGMAPTVLNTTCEGFASVRGGSADTGFQDASVWALQKAADGRPDTVRVRLWARPDDRVDYLPWRDDEVRVEWAQRYVSTAACPSDCFTAEVLYEPPGLAVL